MFDWLGNLFKDIFGFTVDVLDFLFGWIFDIFD